MRLKQGSALDALIVGVLSFISLVEHTVAFDPYKYQRKSVQCDAIRRAPSLEEVKVEMSERIYSLLSKRWTDLCLTM
jgi:hypothetical protein